MNFLFIFSHILCIVSNIVADFYKFLEKKAQI